MFEFNKYKDRIRLSIEIVSAAIEIYKLDGIVALFSGGDDSLTATHLVDMYNNFLGVIHIDTGTGVRETREFVEDACSRYGWDLTVKRPFTIYESLIVNGGFPGPGHHGRMYQFLKERPLRQAVKDVRKKTGARRIGYVTGVRSLESSRRFRNVSDPFRKDKEGVWINPLWQWSKLECLEDLEKEKVKRNPVSEKLGFSGECLCGAYASPDEYRLIELHYPDRAKWIRNCEGLVEQAYEMGLVEEHKYCRWGHGTRIPDEQIEMPGFEMPMCQGCLAKRDVLWQYKQAHGGKNGLRDTDE